MRGGMEVDEGVDISVGEELLPPQVGARSGGPWRSPCAQARANSEVGEGKWRGSQRPAQAAPSGRAGERAPSIDRSTADGQEARPPARAPAARAPSIQRRAPGGRTPSATVRAPGGRAPGGARPTAARDLSVATSSNSRGLSTCSG